MKNKRPFFPCILAAVCLLKAPVVSEASEAASLAQYGMLPVYGQDIADGTYAVEVLSGFPILQAASASLTVSGGELTAELAMLSGDYPSLYLGSAAAAEADTENILSFTEEAADVFTCSFSIPALDQEITCAVYSTLDGQWHETLLLFDASSLPDDALFVSLPDYDLIEEALEAFGVDFREEAAGETAQAQAMAIDLEDGEYSIEVQCVGGSGKASVVSPTLLMVEDARAYARLQWSSPNYDYMVVGNETYYNENTDGGNSVFTIPITAMDAPLSLIADTTAMGTPHEIVYTFTFYSESIGSKSALPQEAAKKVVAIALMIILGGGILNHIVKKKAQEPVGKRRRAPV